MEVPMTFSTDSPLLDQGVGATAEARLDPLSPLIEYYTREMGELPGRLMIATNFLRDVRLMPGWTTQPPETRQAVEQAEALVVSVMIRLLNGQPQCDCATGSTALADRQQWLDSRFEAAPA
jgi:hypothetical protein